MELLSVTMNDGVVKRSQIEGKDNSSEDKSNYKIVRSGDLVYNSMRMWQGANGISKYDGIVSPAYTVLKAVEKIDEGYFAALFKTVKLINEFCKNSQGLTSDTWNLKYPQIAGIRICIPKISEQHKISSFLRLLDKRIDAQRRLVEALKSYKRGLLEYLFSFKSLLCDLTQPTTVPLSKVFAKITDRNSNGKIHKVFTNSAELGLIPQRDYFDKSIAVDENTNNYYVISEGDFVYNPRKSKSAPFGPFNIFRSKGVGIVSPLYTCLRPFGDLNLDYLYWYFQSSSWHRYMYDNGSQGVRHDRVSMTDDILFNIPVLMPDKPAQEKIAALLNLMQRLYDAEVEKVEYLQSEKTQFLCSLFI